MTEQLSHQEAIWLERYQELKIKYANGYVPIPHKGHTSRLAAWIRSQRKRQLNNNLPEHQLTLLSKIGFRWTNELKSQKDNNWKQSFLQSKTELETPSSDGQTVKPNAWLTKQLHRLNSGTVKGWRATELRALGIPRSNINKVREQTWQDKFVQLRLHVKTFRSFPHSKTINYHALGSWHETQRRLARNRKLSDSRLQQLQSIGFTYRAVGKKEQMLKWLPQYESLKAHYQEHGTGPVSKQLLKLSRFVDRQRRDRVALSKKKITLLEEIGFIWDTKFTETRKKLWLLRYRELVQYKKAHDHTRVRSKDTEFPKLGRWVEVQRKNEDTMEEWKKTLLNRIEFTWTGQIKKEKSQKWYENYSRLEDFKARYGHTLVPENWEEDRELSTWVVYQRKPKAPLSPKRFNLLNQLGFAWDATKIKRERLKDGTLAPRIR